MPQRAQQASVNQDTFADVQTEQAAVGPRRKRGRPATVDITETHDVAAWLEAHLGRGIQLIHTKQMGWLLRKWDSWESPVTGPRDGWREIDSTPEGQLGALLVRYQASRGRRPT